MPFTVRLCHDLSGWFATLSDDVVGYPGAQVQWETAVESPDQAMSVLDLAQTLAQRLVGDASPTWSGGAEPTPSDAMRSLSERGLARVSGRAWVTRHREDGHSLVQVQVNQDKHGHGVRLTDSQRRSEAAIYYPSRQMAFDVADALVRIRYRTHVCDRACSGWTEDDAAEERRPNL